MLTIILDYYVVAWSPLFPKESVLAVAVLVIICSASLYRFQVFLYSAFDFWPRRARLVSGLSVFIIFLPAILYLFIAFIIGRK